MSLVEGCVFLTPSEQYFLQHVCGALTLRDAHPALQRYLSEQRQHASSSRDSTEHSNSPRNSFADRPSSVLGSTPQRHNGSGRQEEVGGVSSPVLNNHNLISSAIIVENYETLAKKLAHWISTPSSTVSTAVLNESNQSKKRVRSSSPSEIIATAAQEQLVPSFPGPTLQLIPLQTLLKAQVQHEASCRIPTFSYALDHVLHGGVHLGEVTEVAGPPGAGKTQLLMQLAVSAFLPRMFGGLGSSSFNNKNNTTTTTFSQKQDIKQHQPTMSKLGHWRRDAPHAALSDATFARHDPSSHINKTNKKSRVLYIDSEGSFSPSRFREIASAAVVQVTKIANQPRWTAQLRQDELDALRDESHAFQVEEILKQVQYIAIRSAAELVAVVQQLPLMLASPQFAEIALIVVDSVALPLRQVTEELQRLEELLVPQTNAAAAAGAVTGGGSSSPLSGRSSTGNSPNNHNNSPVQNSSHSYVSNGNPATRSRLAFALGQALQEVARTTGVGVVVTNHVTSQFNHTDIETNKEKGGTSSSNGPSMLFPALGEAWGHCVSTRVLLSTPAGSGHRVLLTEAYGVAQRRRVHVWKSPHGGRGSCEIYVCGAGIRFAPPSSDSSISSN